MTDGVHCRVPVLTAPMRQDGGAWLCPTVGSVPCPPHLPSFCGSLQLLGADGVSCLLAMGWMMPAVMPTASQGGIAHGLHLMEQMLWSMAALYGRLSWIKDL